MQVYFHLTFYQYCWRGTALFTILHRIALAQARYAAPHDSQRITASRYRTQDHSVVLLFINIFAPFSLTAEQKTNYPVEVSHLIDLLRLLCRSDTCNIVMKNLFFYGFVAVSFSLA